MANKPIRETKRKKFLSEDEFQKILSLAYKKRLRDWFLIFLMGSLGLRVGEAIRLKVEDINLKEKIISIPRIKIKTTKGRLRKKELSGESDSMPFSEETFKVVEKYMNRYSPKSGWLFPISKRRAQSIFYEYAREAGVKASIHSLRHYRGVKIYAVTTDLEAVKTLLRHRSLWSASIYATPSIETLRKIAERVEKKVEEKKNSI